MTRFARRFHKIGRALTRAELSRSSMDETFSLTDRDLLDKDAGRRFLDFYGDEGIRTALERYGIFSGLRERGWDGFEIETNARDERHTLLLIGRPVAGGDADRLLELVVRRDRLRCDALDAFEKKDRAFDVLTVEWLTLRNPIGKFSPERLRLPGQDAPGLGMGEQVLELLYRVVDRLSLQGLATVAEYFHNAVLYARELPFVDPAYEGKLDALCSLLFEREKLGFAQAAWAVHWGYVLDHDDSSVRWKGETMVHSDDAEISAYLRSPFYAEHAERTERAQRYRLQRAAFDEHWARHETSLLAPDDSAADDC